MGEAKLKEAKGEERLLSCAGVQTPSGRVQVGVAPVAVATRIPALTRAVTRNPLFTTTVPPSGLTTVTLTGPGVAVIGTSTPTTIDPGVIDVGVTVSDPKVMVAPAWKFEPAMVTELVPEPTGA